MIDSFFLSFFFFFFFFYYYLFWLILLLLLLTFQHPSSTIQNRPKKTIKIRLTVLHSSGHLRQDRHQVLETHPHSQTLH
jgi:hypothetical protein